MSPAKKISIKQAKPNKLFYLVTGATIYRHEDDRCLILKRGDHEPVFPGKWANAGGKLEHEDLDLSNPTSTDGDVTIFEDAIPRLLEREVQEESGLKIGENVKYIGSKVFVRPDGIPVVLLKFGVQYQSGDILLEENAFTEAEWVNAKEVKDYDCIEGVEEEVKATIEAFRDE
jgi:8-oxo-dGTP pyrophosphatase MutT (NUDIX family)